MQPTQDALVFIVDDDAGVREALAWLLRSRRLPSQSFESADAFAAFLNDARHACASLPWVRIPPSPPRFISEY